MSDFHSFRKTLEEKKGLWDNIHAKRKRGEKMRKPGEEGAPTDQDFKNAQKTSKKESVELDEAKIKVMKGNKTRDITKVELHTYLQMGWKKVNEEVDEAYKGNNMHLINKIKKSGVVKTGSMAKDKPVEPKKNTVDEKKLTPAELKKREEIAKAMERDNPGMDMSKKMAIATATAKKVAESTDQLDITEISLDMLTKKISNSGMASTKKANKMDKTKNDLAALKARLAGKKPMTLAKEAKEDDEPASPDESSMAMKQLEFIEYAAEEMMDHIKSGKEFPEWMQNKLTKAHTTIEGLHSSMGEHGEDDEEEDVKEAVRRKGAPKMTGDSFKQEREKSKAHDIAMGRTATGRKKPVRQMTSTQKWRATANESVMSADRKPEKFIKPDGKIGIRMGRVDKNVVDKDK